VRDAWQAVRSGEQKAIQEVVQTQLGPAKNQSFDILGNELRIQNQDAPKPLRSSVDAIFPHVRLPEDGALLTHHATNIGLTAHYLITLKQDNTPQSVRLIASRTKLQLHERASAEMQRDLINSFNEIYLVLQQIPRNRSIRLDRKISAG